MGYINRINPTVFGSGTVIADQESSSSTSKGNLIGESSYAFAGNSTGIAASQSVSASTKALLNSSSLINLGSVFPGQPVTLTITLTATTAGTLSISGYNGHLVVTETISFTSGTKTLTSANSYTNINSITPSVAVTAFTAGTSPLVTTTTLGVKQPQLAASLDMNSSAGAILYPKATQSQIANFDSTVNGITYASTDGMRVYNTTTNSFCEKVNGYWSGLYLEDALKPTHKKVTFVLNSSSSTTLASIVSTANASYQVLPALPSYNASVSSLSSAATPSLNQKANITGSLSYPVQITAKITNTTAVTGGFQAIVTGYYNGVLFSETIGVTTTITSGANPTYTTLAKFTSIVSIVPSTVGTGTFTVSYGNAVSIPVYVIYSAVCQLNLPSTAIAGTGTGNLVLSVSGTTLLTVVGNSQFKTSTGPQTIISTGLSNVASNSNAALLFTNNSLAVTGSSIGNTSIFVSVEYDIIW